MSLNGFELTIEDKCTNVKKSLSHSKSKMPKGFLMHPRSKAQVRSRSSNYVENRNNINVKEQYKIVCAIRG